MRCANKNLSPEKKSKSNSKSDENSKVEREITADVLGEGLNLI